MPMRSNIVRLRDASDVTTRKRQEGTSKRYNELYYENRLPVGGIPASDMYDLAHVSAQYQDESSACLPCLGGNNSSPWILENYQTQYQSTSAYPDATLVDPNTLKPGFFVAWNSVY